MMQLVQDVKLETQKNETKSILKSCTTTGVPPPKQVSLALDLINGSDQSSYVHKGGEMEPRQPAK